MAHYDQLADGWDTPARVARAQQVAAHISPLLPRGDILEYGCGTGLVSRSLPGDFPHITLMDASAGMIDAARAAIARDGHTNMNALAGDMLADDAGIGTYDAIYMSLVLHHIKDTPAILQAFFAHLHPAGLLCIVDLDMDDGHFHRNEPDFDGHHGFRQDDLCMQLQQAGFTDVRIYTFFHGEKDGAGYSLFCATAMR